PARQGRLLVGADGPGREDRGGRQRPVNPPVGTGPPRSGASGGGLRAEVVLDLSVWGLDRPLTYRIPEALAGRVVPGMIVRAPLRGRRVRGWVLAVSEGPQNPDGAGIDTADGLADLAGVSGPAPLFAV